MRHLVLVPCLLALACTPIAAGEPAPTAPVSAVSASERASIDAVVAAMIAAGVPDTRGATLVIGTVEVSEPAPAATDPADNAGGPTGPGHTVLRSNGNRTRIVDGKQITQWKGVHLQLADGTWVLGLSSLLAATAQRTIAMTAEGKRLAAADMPAYFAGQKPAEPRYPGQEDQEQAWHDVFDAQSKPRVQAARAAMRHLDSIGSFWGNPAGLIMLYRAEVPGVADAVFILAQSKQLYRRTNQSVGGPLILDRQSGMWGTPLGDDDEDSPAETPLEWMRRKKGRFGIADATAMLQRELAAWFLGMLLDPPKHLALGFTAEQATKQALACTPEAERAVLQMTIDRLAANRALPEQAPEGADLATRLQAWDPDGQLVSADDDSERHMPDEAAIAQMPADMQKQMRKHLAQRKAWRPAAADIPALIGLLDDPRPSRWIDGMAPRTLGDNALRALFAVMRVDPRVLAGRSAGKAWTDAERSVCAAAIAAWWKGHSGKPLAEALSAGLEQLPLQAAITIIASRKPDERAALLDRLAKILPAAPAASVASTDIARLLGLAESHAGIAGKIAVWPLNGQLRPLLAVWHDRQKRPAELDKLLDELITGGDADDQARGKLAVALKQAMAQPTPARLHRCLALAGGPLTDRRTWAVLGAACEQGYAYDPAWMAVQRYVQESESTGNRRVRQGGDDDQSDPALAIPLVVICTMLADRKPLPEGSCAFQQRGDWGQLSIHGLSLNVQLREGDQRGKQPPADEKPKPEPSGLRVCDLAAVAARNMLWQIGQHDLGRTPLDLWAEIATRDRKLLELSSAFADAGRAACTAAKLPDVLPAAAPPDTKALSEPGIPMTDLAALAQLADTDARLRAAIAQRVVGQSATIDAVLTSLFAGGHALLIGAPGLAKTLIISTLCEALGWRFKRIQFTPDLMPADITRQRGHRAGPHHAATRQRMFEFLPGPIFANMVLADEINRTPPKTQAALLEAMQERKVTIGGADHPTWGRPFHRAGHPESRLSRRAPTRCPRPSSTASCWLCRSSTPDATRNWPSPPSTSAPAPASRR